MERAETWRLVRADEFESEGRPDPTKWSYETGGEGGGNNEMQYNTEDCPANAQVQNSRLIIEARNERWKGHYSPRDRGKRGLDLRALRGASSASVRSRDVAGHLDVAEPGKAWGEHWLDNGEIDIVEHVGHAPDTMHTTIDVPEARSAFNVYALEWTSSEIRGYVNGEQHFSF